MLYIPIAHQLGLYNIKQELEEIYFRFADPVEYRAISNKLKATERRPQKLMTEFISRLSISWMMPALSTSLRYAPKRPIPSTARCKHQNVRSRVFMMYLQYAS